MEDNHYNLRSNKVMGKEIPVELQLASDDVNLPDVNLIFFLL